jgi:hypothetical protein
MIQNAYHFDQITGKKLSTLHWITIELRKAI